MRLRLFRRVAAGGAMIGGVSGIVANLALLGMFALARPWQGASSPWRWLGPANDVIGAVSTAALIPVVVYLGRVLPRSRVLTVVGASCVVGLAGLTLVAPLMLAGVVSLQVQFVVAGVALPAMFGWLLVVNRTGRRIGLFPASLATFGERVGAAALAATGVACAGLLLPAGSAVQYAVMGVAAVAGLPAYAAFPVWPILLARRVLTGPEEAPSETTSFSAAPRRAGR